MSSPFPKKGRVLVDRVWRPCEILDHQGTGIGSEAVVRVTGGELEGKVYEVMDPETLLEYT